MISSLVDRKDRIIIRASDNGIVNNWKRVIGLCSPSVAPDSRSMYRCISLAGRYQLDGDAELCRTCDGRFS